jgi:hypothetical protein
MKRGLLAAAAIGVLGLATPAPAFVVEVTTSVAVRDADDQAQITRAVRSAVDDVLKEGIAFTPTLVVLTRAMVVGERLYLRVLIADQDGDRTVEDLAEPRDPEGSARPKVDL